MFYFICDVGVGKGAVLFLGWMISIMKDYSPAVVLVCFVLLGVGMFLLLPCSVCPCTSPAACLVGSMEDSMGFWASPSRAPRVLDRQAAELHAAAEVVRREPRRLRRRAVHRRDQLRADARHQVLPHAARALARKGCHPVRRAGLAHLRAVRHPARAAVRVRPGHVAGAGAVPGVHRARGRVHAQNRRVVRRDGAAKAAGARCLGRRPTVPPRRVGRGGLDQLLGDGGRGGAGRRWCPCVHLLRRGVLAENTIENKGERGVPVDEEVEAREIKVQAKRVAYKRHALEQPPGPGPRCSAARWHA